MSPCKWQKILRSNLRSAEKVGVGRRSVKSTAGKFSNIWKLKPKVDIETGDLKFGYKFIESINI